MKFIKYALAAILCGVLAIVYLTQNLPDGKLHIHFLDIGQGDSIFIQTPDKKYILVDGGPTSKAAKLISNITGNFNRKIDLVILSHPHSDHYAGLIDVIQKYKIGTIILPNTSGAEPLYNSFLNEISKRKINTIFMPENLDINFGKGVYIDNILSPKTLSKNANEALSIFRVLYGKFSVILTGDAPIEEEYEVLKTNADLRADILKVGHHGSKTSTSGEFLNEITPSIAVIQSGIKNKFGHPHQEALDHLTKRKIRIFRNDMLGTVEFVSDGG